MLLKKKFKKIDAAESYRYFADNTM